jgi:hypothetical protein
MITAIPTILTVPQSRGNNGGNACNAAGSVDKMINHPPIHLL